MERFSAIAVRVELWPLVGASVIMIYDEDPVNSISFNHG